MKVKNLKMGVLGCILAVLLFSCEREIVEPAQPTPEKESFEKNESDSSSSKNNTSTNDSSSTDKKMVTIGDGSGRLEISGVSNVSYIIKPGNYSSLRFEDLENVKISGANKVVVSHGNIDISNVDNLTISDLTIENHDQAAVYIHRSANNLTLDRINFKNISNYAIRFDVNKRYDGSKSSFSENIHLKNITAENIGTLFISKGGIKADGFYGLIKGFKLTQSNVKNSPWLNGLTSLGLAEDYEMSYNTVNNVNASDQYPNGANNHTGIFFAKGNGKVFGNKITNHQGNAVRAWLFSITKPGVVEIHDNIVYNSTRYGAFEFQVPPSISELSNFKPAKAILHNNTVGRLNTGQPKYFEGRLLDLYQTYGEVEIYNNLSFDLRDDILINNMSNPAVTKIVVEENNHYFPNEKDAVVDLINFESKINNVGAR